MTELETRIEHMIDRLHRVEDGVRASLVQGRSLSARKREFSLKVTGEVRGLLSELRGTINAYRSCVLENQPQAGVRKSPNDSDQ